MKPIGPTFFNTPFPRPKRSLKNALWLLSIGLGGSLFILIFKPFNIVNQTGEFYIYLLLLSLGLVFFAAAFFLEFIVPRLIPKLFRNWTLKKAILWYSLVILLVGAVIFLYKSFLGGFRDFSWTEYFFVLGRVLGIGITVSFFVLGIFSYFNRQKLASISSNEDFLLKGPNDKSIRLNLNEVLFIMSDDNYVDIHLESKGLRSKVIFRSSLKNIEAQLVNPLTPIYRCHRRYLINLEHVELKNETLRNASLQLKKYPDEIPVSKQFVNPIFELLHVRP